MSLVWGKQPGTQLRTLAGFFAPQSGSSGLNFQTMKAITALSLVASLLLCGCSGSSFNPVNPPSVHAAPPASFGCAAPAGFQTAKEVPGSNIALVDYPCALLGAGGETDIQRLDSCGVNQVVSLVTTRDIHVHSIRLWIGAGVGSKFENGVCLEIVTAGIVTKTFHKEWDKHIEEHFSDAPFAVDFIIPAGSTVRLSRDPHSAIACNDAPDNSCLTQEMSELFGE